MGKEKFDGLVFGPNGEPIDEIDEDGLDNALEAFPYQVVNIVTYPQWADYETGLESSDKA